MYIKRPTRKALIFALMLSTRPQWLEMLSTQEKAPNQRQEQQYVHSSTKEGYLQLMTSFFFYAAYKTKKIVSK